MRKLAYNSILVIADLLKPCTESLNVLRRAGTISSSPSASSQSVVDSWSKSSEGVKVKSMGWSSNSSDMTAKLYISSPRAVDNNVTPLVCVGRRVMERDKMEADGRRSQVASQSRRPE